MYDYPAMPESPDALRMSRSFREAFRLPGPLSGALVLLLRTWWLFPLAALVVVPFNAVSWAVSCRFGMCRRVGLRDGLLRVDEGSWVDVWSRVLRAMLVMPARIAVIAVSVAALAWVCAGYRAVPRRVWHLLSRRWAGLCGFGLVLVVLPAVLTALPLYFLQLRAAPMLSEEAPASSGGLVLILVLSVGVMLGSLVGIVSGVFASVAVVPFTVRRSGAREALRGVVHMVLRRVPPTLVTVSVALTFPSVVASVSETVVSGGAEAGWFDNVVRDSSSAVLSLPVVAAMYFTRYLDLSRHTDGYDLAGLTADLRGSAAPHGSEEDTASGRDGAEACSDQPHGGVRG
ncbi:hypothetical protein [Actinopolyspora mortivallis]|uniref:Uncharacterized protein n=1 Tax=Actinopolyspora mortivallis TaxID=33906 RepID=A0A2T0GZK3_ACTMO|nr:hypothetical protein [Actinopolyspora mortivallis]PRW64542.1 hypothetical protein CEP50_04080 [Actinopolyspora mortivallis]